jgi:hypothetical protein
LHVQRKSETGKLLPQKEKIASSPLWSTRKERLGRSHVTRPERKAIKLSTSKGTFQSEHLDVARKSSIETGTFGVLHYVIRFARTLEHFCRLRFQAHKVGSSRACLLKGCCAAGGVANLLPFSCVHPTSLKAKLLILYPRRARAPHRWRSGWPIGL